MTVCEYCGPVDGDVPHEELEIGRLGPHQDRWELAREYIIERTDHSDPLLIPDETLVEAMTHIQQLRRRELGLETYAETRNDTFEESSE